MLNRQYQAATVLRAALVANAPKDTWNLALNSIRIVQDNGAWYVLIGGEIAPYAEVTNEPWTSEKWKGKKNPNEGWIGKAIEAAMPQIKQIMSGELTEEEIEQVNVQNWTNVAKQRIDHIKKKEKQLANI